MSAEDEVKNVRLGEILHDVRLRENPEQFLRSLCVSDLILLIRAFDCGIERLTEKVRNYLGLPRKK